MRWGRFDNRLHHSGLLYSVLGMITGGLCFGVTIWWAFSRTYGVRPEPAGAGELLRIVGSVVVAVFGLVTVVVTYRRQRDSERGRFAQIFGAAAKQLGDTDVAVRIAGVYAMAGVADEFRSHGRRQQCVDVLCGYLRLPFDAEGGADHLVSRKESVEESEVKVERTYQFRQNDSEVRGTIVRVIAARLLRSAEISWSHCDFDFTGAVLDQLDLRHAVLSGRHISFARCRFLGATQFEHATFDGPHTTFRGAVFKGGPVSFEQARFGAARPERSESRGTGTIFDEAVFEGQVSFEGAIFRGPRTQFQGTRFLGSRTAFLETAFRAEQTSFERAGLDGEHIVFRAAEFSGATITFTGAQFYAATTTFDEARIGAAPRLRARATRETDFRRAEFHGSLTFARTVFAGRAVDFTEADFFGEISFAQTKFAATDIRFDRPKAWVGTRFDWDDNPLAKPAVVKPNPWPPTPTDPTR
ncbi:pentapeptide repeat-containing protein [Nocardia panacis]|uniref:Pentapeptide repeat-containing protein n=1 Tax=Nocardia panacis TaxID=2340916 RepID=A0A3A4KFQ3_9NOCA|nr:pentapeptide repeat-containing protein [Nocardia panacis]RJO74758.1 pentapeptide repeat-containing protein [Nocardia panacis]